MLVCAWDCHTLVVYIYWIGTHLYSLVLSMTRGCSLPFASFSGEASWSGSPLDSLLCHVSLSGCLLSLLSLQLFPLCARALASGAGRPPLELEGVIP